MNLYFRLLVIILKNWSKPKIHPLQEVTTCHRVMPWDIDVFGHLNNGRYLQIADVSRIAFLARTKILHLALRRRWGAVLGGHCTRYNRALKPLQKFYVTTRVLSWDTRWIFIEHKFTNEHQQTLAISLTRAALRDKCGWVHTEDLANCIAPNIKSPAHPESLKLWLKADDAMIKAESFAHIVSANRAKKAA